MVEEDFYGIPINARIPALSFLLVVIESIGPELSTDARSLPVY